MTDSDLARQKDNRRAATRRKVQAAIDAARRPTHQGVEATLASNHPSAKRVGSSRRDGVLLKLLRTKAAVWWKMGTSFIAAHALGSVDRETRVHRIRQCSACRYRVVVRGHARCYGANGGYRCCPDGRLWPFSRLSWMVGLRNRACPLGEFGRVLPSIVDWIRLVLLLLVLAFAGAWSVMFMSG